MYELLAGKIIYREFFVDFRILVDTFFLGKGYWWTGCVFKSLNGSFTFHNSNIDAKTLHTHTGQTAYEFAELSLRFICGDECQLQFSRDEQFGPL